MAGPQATGSAPPNPLVSFLPFLVILFIFYFLLWRPQAKRQKDHQNMLQALKKGDRVVTSGGLHGTIVGVKEDVVVLKIAEDVKVEVSRSAVADVREKSAE
jgi:preprotein translocase subunit YajC